MEDPADDPGLFDAVGSEALQNEFMGARADALDDGAVAPVRIPREAPLPRFFLVQREEEVEGDHEEVPGPHAGVHDRDLGRALRPVLERRAVVQDRVVVHELHVAGLESHHEIEPRIVGERIKTVERFQVKRIVVKPAGRLSLQLHHHRSEHWVVVQGTAEVTVDDRVQQVHENESIYLPIGCVHRLVNPGKIPLELIEVQVGSYLGEDDIIRVEDVYNRS